jgi:hypothetical protein
MTRLRRMWRKSRPSFCGSLKATGSRYRNRSAGSEGTTAFPHAAFAQLQAPTVCLLLAESEGEPCHD